MNGKIQHALSAIGTICTNTEIHIPVAARDIHIRWGKVVDSQAIWQSTAVEITVT